MNLENYFKNGKIIVWKEIFAIIKAREPDFGAFVNIIDKNEITVIMDQLKYIPENVIKIEKDYKLLTFNMAIPFEVIGFMAKVSRALADEKIALFAISAYSTDHILVKETDLLKTKKVLEKLGCLIEEK